VQAYEPRDYEFILELASNLCPVQISNNWWVDHRIFRPVPEAPKDADVVMVAGWADFKRHYRFFDALRTLRKRGRKIRATLIGYPMGRTKTEILGLAKHYGVDDQLEVYEWISQEQINILLNRSKVNVIWSRREGVNRAIIEGMFAGVPCIVREGFNYGYSYPYINSSTGCFSSEQELPEKLLWMIENYRQFTPREWVMDHLSCQKATEILNNLIKVKALEAGETWSGGPVVKINGLHGMSYWDERDSHRFSKDYEFLTSVIR
jgi:glycosyltransferase involved in cell wall biosynthesis